MRYLISALCALVCIGATNVTSSAQGSPFAAPRIAGAIDETSLIALKGNVHPLAQSQYDHGAVAGSLAMDHMLLQLKRSPEQEQALQTLLGELNDPSSANYHKWLTAAEFGEQFGPAQQDIDTVTAWLKSHGFRVNLVYPSGMMIDVSGTAAQVRKAFHTEIHNYRVNGEDHIANAADPQIPAALAPLVVGFASLNDFIPRAAVENVGEVTKDSKSGKWKPAGWDPSYSFSYQNSEQYDVGPLDFAKIYNIAPLWTTNTGQGQTIVVIEDTNINAADWNTFRSAFGLSSYPGTLIQVQPPPKSGANNCNNPGTNGDEIEAALDAEWSSAVAPGATIELASCADTRSTFGGLIAAQNLLNSKTPPAIMSVSYGECEGALGASGNAAFNNTWAQAASEGVSVYVAAGDWGAAVCNAGGSIATQGIAVSGFASTPNDVAVGGTDFQDFVNNNISTYWTTTNGAGGASVLSYVPEIPWNDSCASGILASYMGYASGALFCNSTAGKNFLDLIAGSGGPSSIYNTKPSWQQNVLGVPNDKKRDLPDVSLFAANGLYSHALLFCMSDTREGGKACTYTNSTNAVSNSAGGTSFAAPAFAGIQALVNQKTGLTWGNPDAILYSLAATEYSSSSGATLSTCQSSNGNGVNSACTFYDIAAGDNDVVCSGRTNCYTPTRDRYGVLSTSLTTSSAAYPANKGWDFATGLGTVNVTNLVNNWP